MGIVFDTNNSYLTTFLDIVLIFCLGGVLLFLSNVIQNNGNFLMVYITFIVMGCIIFNMVFMHNKLKKEIKEKNTYNILTFLNIYVMFLMSFVSGLTYYQWMKDPA